MVVKALDDLAPAVDLCPRCGLRPQEDDRTGFCEDCATEHAVERYVARDAGEIARRREAWRERSLAEEVHASAPVNRERQRRHRLLERVRPREPAHAGADPYELAREALVHLARLRAGLPPNSRAVFLVELEAVEELVRRLAWGPGP